MLKPALSSLMEETKNSKVSKVEELINLQKQSLENDMMLDGKKALCTAIQTKINEVESQVDLLKMEIEDHALKCSSEIEKIKEELTAKEEQVNIMERDAQELLMESEEKLKKTCIESAEDTQLCAQELYALIDSVSQYKEFMGSIIVGIREEIKEIAEGVKKAFEASISQPSVLRRRRLLRPWKMLRRRRWTTVHIFEDNQVIRHSFPRFLSP